LRDNSEGSHHPSKNIIGVSHERQSAITQQFYSPSDSRKILKYKSKTNQSVEKKKGSSGGKTERNLQSDNLYLSYRRNSKSGLKNTASKPKLVKESNSLRTDDTFERDDGNLTKTSSSKNAEKNNIDPNHSQRQKYNNLSKTKSNIVENSLIFDSAKNSQISNSMNSNDVNEFLEAAANGNRDKIDKLLNS
jgi:ABC-type Na+ efflux pump permease subunit